MTLRQLALMDAIIGTRVDRHRGLKVSKEYGSTRLPLVSVSHLGDSTYCGVVGAVSTEKFPDAWRARRTTFCIELTFHSALQRDRVTTSSP